MKSVSAALLLLVLLCPVCMADAVQNAGDDSIHVRVNLMGYRPGDTKAALVMSNQAVRRFAILDEATGRIVYEGKAQRVEKEGWAPFKHFYALPFSPFRVHGRYRIAVGEAISAPFSIHKDAYSGAVEQLLEFMRQQRCGYNPYLDMACHRADGRAMYGPMPDSTFVDVSGGWHDAGDQLKYLITSSWATGAMLMAYLANPSAFTDTRNALGQPEANGVADVLDEARWGLEWIHRMHPESGQLFHQVADDRDHLGWKWPDKDNSDYGWGPNSYRVAYFASGKPQGLREFKSKATGIGNLTGRVAATMALGYRIWRDMPGESAFARKCLDAAIEVYDMGRKQEGYQQGNSYGAPYRYTEDTWADDMEWGAAELFTATGERRYLEDARRYARLAGSTSWMGRDTTDHYQMYPFVSFGHYALHGHADPALRDSLAEYYRTGIEKTLAVARRNAWGVGVPFIWCSNNLVTALITQIDLYERMTGDMRYRNHATVHRDWLLGHNPWGTSMFTGMPSEGDYPLDVHTSVWHLTHQVVPGGLVDGPIYGTINRQLKGLTLLQPDEYAAVQPRYVVYHDDIGDYSTNEPTMDGTAGAIYIMAVLAPSGATSRPVSN